MSRVSAIYHIVINTKFRKMTITEQHKHELYRYITGIVKNRGCKLLQINGIANHIHILLDLSPAESLSVMVAEIKRASSMWAKSCGLFINFEGWGNEYYAASVSLSQLGKAIEYVKNQEEHHLKMPFEDEFKFFVVKTGFDWNDNLLT